MKRILLLNDLKALRKEMAGWGDTGNLRYIVMDDNKEALEIKGCLSGAMRIRGITRREMLRRLGEDFKRDFSKSVLDINIANDSVEWWAMNFTSKLPAMSKLYENAFSFASIKTIMADVDGLIIVSENQTLYRQLKEWSAKAGIKLTNAMSPRFNFKRTLSRYTPAMIIHMFLKLVCRKLLSVNLLKKITWLAKSDSSVIVTQFEDRSISRDDIYRDIYLPGMKDLLPDLDSIRSKTPVTVGFSPYNFAGFIFKLARRRIENAGIYPMEYFLSIRELSGYFMLSLKRFFHPKGFNGSFRICGEDASLLISEEIRQSVSCGQFLLNLSAHASMGSFSKRYGVKTLYYPFENRSWEKMVILAFRKSSPRTRIIGYQHTVIGPRHLCYFMERGESGRIPMPDAIVTDGEITKKIMMGWNFPENMLRTGPALRFALAKRPASEIRASRIRNILVPLTTGLDEYVKMFMFLEEAFGASAFYNIVIRPHPTVSFDQVFRIFTPSGLKYSISDSTIEGDLADCDLVLYAASTVSLEAMAIGKPVIHIELDDYIDSDPVFNTDAMKWSCSNPAELTGLIRSIDSLDASSMERMRLAAAEYTRKYFYPVNRENLAAFLP